MVGSWSGFAERNVSACIIWELRELSLASSSVSCSLKVICLSRVGVISFSNT